MKNLIKRFYAKHSASLALVLTEHRILICQIIMAVGVYNAAGTVLIWVNMHYGFLDFLPVFSSLEGVLRFFSGILLIGGGWHFYDLFKADKEDNDKLKKRQKLGGKVKLKELGEMHLN